MSDKELHRIIAAGIAAIVLMLIIWGTTGATVDRDKRAACASVGGSWTKIGTDTYGCFKVTAEPLVMPNIRTK